jgi:hypothetical protein
MSLRTPQCDLLGFEVPILRRVRIRRPHPSDETFCGELFNAWWENAPHRTIKAKTFAMWDVAGRPPPGERPVRRSFATWFARLRRRSQPLLRDDALEHAQQNHEDPTRT